MATSTDRALSAAVTLDPDHHRGAIDPRLFGSFVEHMGRCVYTGIYEPGHPRADQHGFRADVAELVDELGITLVRYPGGNFVSSYRWEDGVGPVADRPRRLDLAWHSIEPNTVGTDEFLGWANRCGLEPMMTVNLGTRGIQEAADLVEYCNIPGGTALSDLRRRNGTEAPHGVRLWCLGNEMDGPWQVGHKDAETYGRLAAETGKAMKLVDPGIELVVAGSSGREMPTFGAWESTVLEHCYDRVEYISLHAYYEEYDGDRRSFLGSGESMARFISDVVAISDAVGARRGSRRRLRLSFDEWNVWYQRRFAEPVTLALDEAPPRLEDVYSTLDAVVVGDLLITLLNHADRVAIGCLAQLVNVIAPIMTEPGGGAWRQTTFHPVAETIRAVLGDGHRHGHGGGAAPHSLVASVSGPTMVTARYGEVPVVSAAATRDPETGKVSVFLVNRADRPVDVTIRHPGLPATRPADAKTILADTEGPRHGAEQAAAGRPTPVTAYSSGSGATTIGLAPESWTLLCLTASG